MSRILSTKLILAIFCLVIGFASQALGDGCPDSPWCDENSGELSYTGGNVGIGTTDPQGGLHVSGEGGGGTALIERSGKVLALNPNYGGRNQFAHISTLIGSDMGLKLDVNDQSALTITKNGAVGIGETGPHDGKLVVANSATDEAYISLNPDGGAGNDFVGLRASESGNNTTKLHFGREFTYDSAFKDLVTLEGRTGNVGIGTERPSAKLDVEGTTRTTVLEITGGGDLAEPFDIAGSEAIKPGMVVAIDPEHPGQLRIADKAYDRTVAGCVSGAKGINPGLTMRQEGSAVDGSLPVALSGRVYCRADTSSGAIQPGDLLTTSDTPGYAIRVTNYAKAQGAIFGKAMTSLDQGRGLVLVLVTLQ